MHELKSGLMSSHRSKPRSFGAVEVTLATSRTEKKKVLQETVDDYAQFQVRCKLSEQLPLRSRSFSTAPSAWALSSGRSLHPQLAPLSLQPVPNNPPVAASTNCKRDLSISSSTRKGSGTNGVSVSGVLKYFSNKIKKVSPLQEEEYHQFRIMHNRLLQWRFANARAEVSMAALKRAAHKKCFNAWLNLSPMRNYIAEKRLELQRLMHKVKLFRIINSEIYFLKQWARIESRHCQAVERLATKLSTISICSPLVQGAKGDIASILDAMSSAMEVMENIEAIIKSFEAQVEQVCFLLTELSIIVKEQKDDVDELEIGLATVESLEAEESSLRVHCMELADKSRTTINLNLPSTRKCMSPFLIMHCL